MSNSASSYEVTSKKVFLQMGRTPGLEWQYVSKLKPQEGRGQFTCKCNFYIRGHTLGLPAGHGVASCTKAAEPAKEVCRRLHVGGKTHGREVYV